MTRNSGKSASRTRISKHAVAMAQTGPFAISNSQHYILPMDDDIASQASSRKQGHYLNRDENLDTVESNDDRKQMSVQSFMKDTGAIHNSFAKFSNHNA